MEPGKNLFIGIWSYSVNLISSRIYIAWNLLAHHIADLASGVIDDVASYARLGTSRI